jgi:HNH endonuclease
MEINCIRCAVVFDPTAYPHGDSLDELCPPCVDAVLATAPGQPQCALCGAPEDDLVCMGCHESRRPATATVLPEDVVRVWDDVTFTWFGSERRTGGINVSLWASSPAAVARDKYHAAVQHDRARPNFVAACPLDSAFTVHLDSHGGVGYVWRYQGVWWIAHEDLTRDRMKEAILVNRAYQVCSARGQRDRQIERESRAEEDRLITEADAIEAERRRASDVARARSILGTDAAGSGGRRQPIPRETRLAVFNRDGGRCAECGSNFDIQYDHIIPVAMGGSSTVENLQILCADCNRRKGPTLG